MLTFLCLPKIENIVDREIQHINWNSKAPLQKWICFEIHWVLNCFQFIYIRKLYKYANVVNFVYYGKTRVW